MKKCNSPKHYSMAISLKSSGVTPCLTVRNPLQPATASQMKPWIEYVSL